MAGKIYTIAFTIRGSCSVTTDEEIEHRLAAVKLITAKEAEALVEVALEAMELPPGYPQISDLGLQVDEVYTDAIERIV